MLKFFRNVYLAGPIVVMAGGAAQSAVMTSTFDTSFGGTTGFAISDSAAVFVDNAAGGTMVYNTTATALDGTVQAGGILLIANDANGFDGIEYLSQDSTYHLALYTSDTSLFDGLGVDQLLGLTFGSAVWDGFNHLWANGTKGSLAAPSIAPPTVPLPAGVGLLLAGLAGLGLMGRRRAG